MVEPNRGRGLKVFPSMIFKGFCCGALSAGGRGEQNEAGFAIGRTYSESSCYHGNLSSLGIVQCGDKSDLLKKHNRRGGT